MRQLNYSFMFCVEKEKLRRNFSDKHVNSTRIGGRFGTQWPLAKFVKVLVQSSKDHGISDILACTHHLLECVTHADYIVVVLFSSDMRHHSIFPATRETSFEK